MLLKPALSLQFSMPQDLGSFRQCSLLQVLSCCCITLTYVLSPCLLVKCTLVL